MFTQERSPALDNQELQDAIEALYQVFSRYPLRAPVTGCPCCVTQADMARLASKPLRNLLNTDINRYSMKALTTWGDEDDFRHFLPRLFELHCTDIEVLFGKLTYGHWQKWPEPEQQALKDYFLVLWETMLRQTSDHYHEDADTWLCAIGQAEDDLSPYLALWQQFSNDAAWENLSLFVDENIGMLLIQGLNNSFWRKREAQAHQVISWLRSPHLREMLENRFFNSFDPAQAEQLARTIDQLYTLAQYY